MERNREMEQRNGKEDRSRGKPMTEKDWLRGVGRMWEVIRRTTLLCDYNKTLQRMHAFA